MSDSSSLPAGCVLRPANSTDKALIQQLLKNLEREISPPSSSATWFWGGILLGSLGIVGTIGVLDPKFRSLLHLLVGPISIVGLGLSLSLLLGLEREWMQYWVIESEKSLVACAKLQRQDNYSVLYDLYVIPAWRGQGLGSYLVKSLEHQANKPLYLACLPARLPFYTRLGFSQIPPKRLPFFLQYDLGLFNRPGIIPLVLM